ncbi:hypothetical protein BH24BAC1_BH24BAC1_41030 [soil metagenome]
MPRRRITGTQWKAIATYMNKGLDATFVHYGIRQEDLRLIEQLAEAAGLDLDWVKDLLRDFHEKKTKKQELEDKDVQKLLDEHLGRLPQQATDGMF